MDVSRAQGITDVMKNITGLGKAIKKPSTLKYIAPGESRLPEAIAGSQVIRILMIAVASLLLIGIIFICLPDCYF